MHLLAIHFTTDLPLLNRKANINLKSGFSNERPLFYLIGHIFSVVLTYLYTLWAFMKKNKEIKIIMGHKKARYAYRLII